MILALKFQNPLATTLHRRLWAEDRRRIIVFIRRCLAVVLIWERVYTSAEHVNLICKN
jgi:hypothetical protein